MKLRRSLLGCVGLALAAGCGEMKSLGENHGTGGNTGGAAEEGGGGTESGGKPTGGAVATGGVTNQEGGSTGAGGSFTEEGGATTTGGRAIQDGGAWTGGTSSGGFIGRNPTKSDAPYPLAPSVPINAGCECGSDESVCNAASECVPRCDGDGDCALWKLNGGLSSLWAEGNTVFALESLPIDRLGNVLGSSQRLLTAELGARFLSHVADVPATAATNRFIIGHHGNALYMAGADIVARYDDNTIQVFVPPPGYYSAVLKGDGLYVTNADGIWELDVAPGTSATTFSLIHSQGIEPGTQLVAGDDLWFSPKHSHAGDGWAEEVCALSVEASARVVGCTPILGTYPTPFAARGSQVFVRTDHGSVNRIELGKDPFLLFRPTAPGDLSLGEATLFGDSFYAYIGGDNHRLVRFSTQSADLEVDVIPKPVVTVMTTEQPALGYKTNAGILYAVSSAGLFWIQGWNQLEEANFSRYVFHRPL